MAQKIRDVMHTNPVSLDADQPVMEAARRMRDDNIGDVLVMERGTLKGILTDRDVVVRCLAEGLDPMRTTIGEICSCDLTTLKPNDAIDEAVKLMRDKAIRRIPVVEDGAPIGIVSIGDLAVERDPRSALGQISAAAPNN